MDRDEFVKGKFITVAGRAGSMEEFAAQVKKNLYDNFSIVAVHGLGEFGIDDKERYLAFIAGDSKTGQTFNAQEQKLIGAHLGAHTHNSLEEAFDFSKEEYPTFGEEEMLKQQKFDDLAEKFPGVTATEAEQFEIFESLTSTGKIKVLRCLFDDTPAIALVSIAGGSDELRVRPFAILLNNELENKIEFPSEDDI